MPDQTPAAFISYCRDDSEFALRLAQDLKAAGAPVWIDQLDISAGQLWDNAVEDALIASPRVLLILSPGSARSDNVRNEISFALEQGKTVIPVLYRDCTVPLQLQRANRIDFRADYARGLSSLLASLQVAHPDPEVLHAAAEAETRRKIAWEARQAEAQRLQQREQEREERKPPPPSPQPAPPPQAPVQPSQPVPRPASQLHVAPAPSQPEPVRPWFSLRIGKFAIVGGLAFAVVFAVILTRSQSGSSPTVSSVAAPAARPPEARPERQASPRRPEPQPYAEQIPACVFDPVSNIRTEPTPQSPIACSIDTIRTIQVNPTPVQGARGGLWWQTDACGKPGYVAANQVHVRTQCTP